MNHHIICEGNGLLICITYPRCTLILDSGLVLVVLRMFIFRMEDINIYDDVSADVQVERCRRNGNSLLYMQVNQFIRTISFGYKNI